ncbi:M48 family metallopeptidase [Rhodoferax sp.]|uniref:M48 family metallopeptidase n=1 Tax=Rhodoferax sp. TaxID=50421 RepID=UPI0026087A89|nr:M48 family metallopeptidase [Rhodoferax sp.]MDD2811211.1 M48 family metallopeptidase [Rhodoferax sp.]MDD4943690.1 M48 family metallopeptidase [Rhodoferax sp.]MDD5478918.1 M48 family metallopeptidase [Rhodoferax sp.]
MTCTSYCSCHQRRALLQAGGLVWLVPALGWSQTAPHEGVNVGGNSVFTKLVSAQTIEASAAQQYTQMLQQAAGKNALAGKDHPQLRRLRAIAQKIIPHAMGWNPRAQQWRWEVNLIGSKQINAFCMPGGKIAFYSGILEQLKLTDHEVATVMGHEVAHALREHARERMGKNAATGIGANLLSSVLGLGQLGQTVTSYGAQLLTLQFSRSDESEADLVGMELAARAGFDPRAGVSLWQKMAAASKGAPPQWLSTHPSGTTRIADIQANLPKVLPLYQRSTGQPAR